MSGRSPPLYCTLILITMRSHQSDHNITTVVIHTSSYEYSTTVNNSAIETSYRNIGAWVNSNFYTSILYNLIVMQGYCTTTEYTGSLGYNSVSDGCLKKNQNRCTRLWGKKQMSKRLGGIKGCKVFKEKSERYITSRNGWVSKEKSERT